MLIGQARGTLNISDDEWRRLCTARNFASHAAIEAPCDELRPEVIAEEVEQCARLLDRLIVTDSAAHQGEMS